MWKSVTLAAVAVVWAETAHADLSERVAYVEPAGTLVMPFDSTTNKASFQIVTHVAGGQDTIATHWSFWAADCKHLFDFVVCLTPDDTVVVDPTALQAEIQAPNPPANVKIGPTADLTDKRGVVTVTAFEADFGRSGRDCRILDPAATLNDLLVGAWTIANTSTNASFGGDAIGLSSNGPLPDVGVLGTGGVRILTYNPESLTDSEVILLPVRYPAGNGEFADTEIGPISSTITCDATFVDNLEIPTSMPDLRFKCAGFFPISANAAEEGEASIIPPNTTVDSPGFVHLQGCRTSSGPLSGARFLFAFHGQAVGPFGTSSMGKYTRQLVQ